MYTYAHQSTENQTARYHVTVPTADIEQRFEKALEALTVKTSVEGFRKGKAPKNIVLKTLGKERIYERLIEDLIPEVYAHICKEEKLKPFMQPKVALKEAQEGKDWIIDVAIALEPLVTLPDYKAIVQNVRAEGKKDDIWIPGKDLKETADAKDLEKKEAFLNEVLRRLLESTDIQLSELIIEEEITIRLSRLIDDVRKIGLTVESYLNSRQLTQEKLREQFNQDILNTYKLEYALNEIGDKEAISVDKDELEGFLKKLAASGEQKVDERNAYVYASMLRKQKILDYLGGL